MVVEQQEVDCSKRETIDRLYKLMVKASISKVYSVVRRMDVAREIAQEVFIKLWKAGGKFPNDRAVYVWIYKASHRAGIDYVRSAAYRYEKAGEDYAASPDEARTSFADQLISREALAACVKLLSEQEADILVYTALDRMTQAEVADVMGMSLRTVQRVQAKIEERLQAMPAEKKHYA